MFSLSSQFKQIKERLKDDPEMFKFFELLMFQLLQFQSKIDQLENSLNLHYTNTHRGGGYY